MPASRKSLTPNERRAVLNALIAGLPLAVACRQKHVPSWHRVNQERLADELFDLEVRFACGRSLPGGSVAVHRTLEDVRENDRAKRPPLGVDDLRLLLGYYQRQWVATVAGLGDGMGAFRLPEGPDVPGDGEAASQSDTGGLGGGYDLGETDRGDP